MNDSNARGSDDNFQIKKKLYDTIKMIGAL